MHVELAEPPEAKETLVGLHETARPVDGTVEVVMATTPEKPFTLVRMMVDELFVPDWMSTIDGLAETM